MKMPRMDLGKHPPSQQKAIAQCRVTSTIFLWSPKERLRAKGLRRVDGDGVSVVWSPVKGRPSYDMKGIREAAEKAGIDLAEYQLVGDPTDQLVIRVAGQSRSAT